jgi:hypothetical protein
MFDFDSVILIGPMGSQAFWIWLTLGIALLGVEVFLGTQWLLWSAAAAGVVAVVCLTGLPFGFALQVATFAVLSLALSLLTKRLLRVPQAVTDINEPHTRLLGKQAEVLSGFDVVTGGERTGRVIFDGVEWPAVLQSRDTTLKASDRVLIAAIAEGRLYVTPIA